MFINNIEKTQSKNYNFPFCKEKKLKILDKMLCMVYSCIIFKVQYLAWYEGVRASEKGRKKDNLWDANSSVITKFHYLDFLLLLVQSHGKFSLLSHPYEWMCRRDLQLLVLSATLTCVYTKKWNCANFNSIPSRKFAKDHVLLTWASTKHVQVLCVFTGMGSTWGQGIPQASNGKRRRKDAF